MQIIRKNQTISPQPFFIGLGRAMVSLGPLSSTKYCPFGCAFCYVQDLHYHKYPHWDASEIVTFLKDEREKGKKFNIIYVSGDTDSFASPRTSEGIKLLESLEALDADITFTTRTIFNDDELFRLKSISQRQKKKKLMLVAAISIPRLYSAPHLETINTPQPQERILTLKKLKKNGLFTMLALRPFLPIIPLNEYKEIINLTKDFIDVVLGESWYVDKNGIIENRVFRGPTPSNVHFVSHRMDFDYGQSEWKLWEAKEPEITITNYCKTLNIPFFMRSKPAFELLKRKIA